MSWKSPRPIRGLEIAIAVLGAHLFLLSLFRSYLPLGGPGRSFVAGSLALFALVALRTWRDRGTLREPVLLLFACFLGVFVALEDHGGRVGNDGTMLFIYVRSAVIDHDLDLTNEFEEFVPSKFQEIARLAEPSGRPPDPGHEVGAVLFWLPFYLAAHLLVGLGNLFGGNLETDGYSYPYMNAVCLGSLVWAYVGVRLSYAIARRHFGAWTSAVAAVVLWLASPLVWYTVFEPSMSHGIATAAVAIFLWAWLAAHEKATLAAWIGAAMAAGLMVSVQRYNVFYLVAPLIAEVGRLPSLLRSMTPEARRRFAGRAGLVAAALLVATSPFWVTNLWYHGSLLREGDRLTTALQFWRHPAWSELLYSSNHGLFATTPVAYVAVLGLALAGFRGKRLALVFLVTFAFGVYLLSSTWDWYAGSSFGSRRLTEAYPVFLFGLTAALELLVASPRLLAAFACLALVSWNVLLMGQKKRGEIPDRGTFAFSDAAERATERLYEDLGHAPSAPANWLFAWVYGVSPARFDLVWGHRAFHNLEVDWGSSEDVRFLGRGWSDAERGPSGDSFRWSDGPESSALVHLFEPYDYLLRLEGETARIPGGEPKRIEVTVNGERAGLLTWIQGAPSVELPIPRRFFETGLNEIVFRYGTTVRAGDVYGGPDPRELAVRVSRLSLTILK